MSIDEMHRRANSPWNRRARVPIHRWLLQDSEVRPNEFERLKALGNCVIPQCAHLAVTLIGHHLEGLLA